MALEYEFQLSDPRGPEELLAAAGIGQVAGLSLKPCPPTAARVHIVREACGFTSRICLLMRRGSAGDHNLLRAVMALLKTSNGDAALFLNYETPLLLRRQGKLMLNAECGWWRRPAMLELVDMPYSEESLPSL